MKNIILLIALSIHASLATAEVKDANQSLESFVGQYSLVHAEEGRCSNELQISLDGNIMHVDSMELNIGESVCVKVPEKSNDAEHTDCVSIRPDEVKNSRTTPVALGLNIESIGVKFSKDSRDQVVFYKENTNFGTAFVLAKMLDESPEFKCQYTRK